MVDNAQIIRYDTTLCCVIRNPSSNMTHLKHDITIVLDDDDDVNANYRAGL